MHSSVKDTLQNVINGLFPEDFTCALCGREIFQGRFCPECSKKIAVNSGATCPVCGRKTATAEICIECKAHAPMFEKAVSPLVYTDGTIALIAKFKNGSPWLCGYFAKLIAEKMKSFPKIDLIVCVPATAAKKRERGYNQSDLLCRKLSEILNIPYENAIVKTRETRGQKQLSRAERVRNLDNCFRANRKSVGGKTVLIVDDIMTTGLTLESVCKALKKAGARKVYAATVASVENKPPVQI